MLEQKKITVKEAAKTIGVSASLIYSWCHERRLKHFRVGSKGRRGKILIDPGDLEAFMRQCLVEEHPLLRR